MVKRVYFLFTILSLAVFLSGCSQTVVKYQCADGSFVDSANSCSSVSCKTDCPQLDCANCPPKIEYKDKIVEKPVDVIKYQCYDGVFEIEKSKCKSPEVVNTGLSDGKINVTINSASSSESINQDLELLGWLKPQEGFEYLKIDITIKNNYRNLKYIALTIKDSEGYVYREQAVSSGFIKDYLPSDLGKGEFIRGSRILEVRKNTKFKELKIEALDDSYQSFEYKILFKD